MKKYLKLIVVIAIIVLFVWFLVINPAYTFKQYESTIEDAAKKYFDINTTHLPTGDRVATVSVQKLFEGSFLKEDMYIPYSKSPCSITESWVKVVKKDNEYKYITYLKCGALESRVDHEGPQIILKGDEEMTIERNSKFEDPGIEKVVDKKDGNINKETVKVTGTVDTSKVDTYDITYTAVDSLGNKTIKVRKITIEENLAQTVKSNLIDGYYKESNSSNNYIRLSNMIFRIIKLDDNNNVIAVADQDIININYSKIDDWLNNYYFKVFTKESKEYLVKNKYCKDTPDSKDLSKCNSYTNERYFYIPNAVYINATKNESGVSYLKPFTMTWVASSNDKQYVTRNFFQGEYYGHDYYPTEKYDNYGLRPLITIKGKSKIISGDGSENNPYSFNEVSPGKGGEKINTRYVGEYIRLSGYLWRIVETLNDGTTKVIMMDTIAKSNERRLMLSYPHDNIYNPKEKDNVGYFINNKLSEYVNTSYFANHEIQVKLYNKNIVYGKEVKTKKYKVKLAAPDMYEIFSAGINSPRGGNSYWMTNSTSDGAKVAVISENGSVINENIQSALGLGARVVGYLKDDVLINSGKGTEQKPYVVKR